jgi:hypothetical protein
MSKQDDVKSHAAVALSVPALLCSFTFVTNIYHALQAGHIDNAIMHQLLASADGFETVVLCVVMYVLKRKKKDSENDSDVRN